MPAYCFFDNIKVDDPFKLEEYKKSVVPVVEKYGGRYIVFGGQTDIVEGNWKPVYLVILEFPNLEQAYQWYNSEEYRELKSPALVRGTI